MPQFDVMNFQVPKPTQNTIAFWCHDYIISQSVFLLPSFFHSLTVLLLSSPHPGKGGETIKQLQEKSGAKMVIIQDGPQQENEKPLRISGEQHKVREREYYVCLCSPFLSSSECEELSLPYIFCFVSYQTCIRTRDE